MAERWEVREQDHDEVERLRAVIARHPAAVESAYRNGSRDRDAAQALPRTTDPYTAENQRWLKSAAKAALDAKKEE